MIKQVSAVDLVRLGVEALGGKGGGGRPDMAQGGGPDIARVSNALTSIEGFIKKNEDYKQDLGYAVRIDKFAESSIDMYVRCFTKTSEWEEWLAVKERLAIGIKKIVEKNKASFAFPSRSIYVEKK